MTSVTYKDTSGPVEARIRAAIARTMGETAAALEAEAKGQAQRLIYATPESASYRRTGNLMNSITHSFTEDSATVTAGAEYAIYVHEGTRHMTPRPFLVNAAKAEFPRIAERLRRALS